MIKHCQYCAKAMPPSVQPHKRYCSASRRTLAWMMRRRIRLQLVAEEAERIAASNKGAADVQPRKAA
jgi:hypothetical protein